MIGPIGILSSSVNPASTMLDLLYPNPTAYLRMSECNAFVGFSSGYSIKLYDTDWGLEGTTSFSETSLGAGAGTITGGVDGPDKSGRNAHFSNTSSSNGKYLYHDDFGGHPAPTPPDMQSFRVSFWFKTSTHTNYIMSIGEVVGKGISFALNPSGNLYASAYRIGADLGWEPTSSTALNDGKWHHIMLSNAKDLDARLYVDGVLDAVTDPYADSPTGLFAESFYIGAAKIGSSPATTFCGTDLAVAGLFVDSFNYVAETDNMDWWRRDEEEIAETLAGIHPHPAQQRVFRDYIQSDAERVTLEGFPIKRVFGSRVVQYDNNSVADPSIALTSSGNECISYYDSTNEDLKYAAWNGSAWAVETVDSTGNVGYYSSLALDSSGNPHISYFDATNFDLKYAAYNGSTWDIETVDSTGAVGYYTALALDSSGNPHISYRTTTSGDLKYATWNGSTWDIETVDSADNVGHFTSLALDSSDNPHISYFDITNNDLKHAAWNGSTWDIETVDSTGTVGYDTSLALDDSNQPHISYYDVTNADLKYAAWNGSTWDIETVDSTGIVGYYPSLALDSSNNPHISYYDTTNTDLKYAAWNGSTWDIEIVVSTGSGTPPSLALDSSDNPHIAYYLPSDDNMRCATAPWITAWTGGYGATNFSKSVVSPEGSGTGGVISFGAGADVAPLGNTRNLIKFSPGGTTSGRYLSTDFTAFSSVAKHTISFWIKTTASGNVSHKTGIVGVSGGGKGLSVTLGSTGKICTLRYESGQQFEWSVVQGGPTVVNDGEWHHVAIVHEASGTNYTKFYIDGVLDSTTTETVSAFAASNLTAGNAKNWDGTLCEFVSMTLSGVTYWHNVALPIETIQRLAGGTEPEIVAI